jgi:hypothetical protein
MMGVAEKVKIEVGNLPMEIEEAQVGPARLGLVHPGC